MISANDQQIGRRLHPGERLDHVGEPLPLELVSDKKEQRSIERDVEFAAYLRSRLSMAGCKPREVNAVGDQDNVFIREAIELLELFSHALRDCNPPAAAPATT